MKRNTLLLVATVLIGLIVIGCDTTKQVASVESPQTIPETSTNELNFIAKTDSVLHGEWDEDIYVMLKTVVRSDDYFGILFNIGNLTEDEMYFVVDNHRLSADGEVFDADIDGVNRVKGSQRGIDITLSSYNFPNTIGYEVDDVKGNILVFDAMTDKQLHEIEFVFDVIP